MLKETILPKLILLNTRIVLGTYTAVTLPFYTVLQRPWQKLKQSKKRWVEVERAPDGSYFYWKRVGDPLKLPHDYHHCKTFQEIYNKMKQVEDMNVNKLGFRKVLSAEIKYDEQGNPIKQDGRPIKEIKLANEFTWLKTGQVFQRIEDIARGFKSFNLTPSDKVTIFAETRIEWLLSSLALLYLEIPLSTLFPNLGSKGLIHGINQQKSKIILTTFDLLDQLSEVIKQTPSVEKIVYMQYDFQKQKPLPKFSEQIKLIPFEDLEKIGQQNNQELPKSEPDMNNVAVVMYTSGTTGIPKAVIFTHKQIRSGLLTLASNVVDIADQAPKHSYASYLPLAHSMGFTMELFLFVSGVKVGYSSPYTLTDSSPGNPPGQPGDLRLLKPTTFITVPLVLDKVVKEIYMKLASRSPILPPLFTYLMNYKIRWTKRGYATPIIDKIVCSRVQEQFGGNLQFVICGGAAVNQKTEELVRAALNVTLMCGYGLTETTGGVIGMRRDDLNSGTAGIPLEGVKLRLVNWEEGGYTIDDKPNPRGEIVISGDSVAEGYYGLEEETKAVFKVDANGIKWFYTGDIGEILPNGSLKIIDRKKDLAKLPNGEYLSLGKIETSIKTAPTVENCCVCLHPEVNEIVALVTPHAKQLKLLAEKLNKSHLTYEQMCADPEIKQAIFNEIQEICELSGLHKKEIPVAIHVCDEEWSPDNDLLTAAMKLKRNNVLKHYKKEIDQMFEQIRKK